MDATYLGLDLAWSAHRPTGACAADGEGRIIDERMLGSTDEIIAWVAEHSAAKCVVAIDAPVFVPNATGRRAGENELARAYGSRKASPHTSNRTRLLEVHGEIRGEVIVEQLRKTGFGDPWAGSQRTYMEVYPHPAIIEAFGLPERLIYKAKKDVSVDQRREGLRTLSGLIDTLADADPPLIGSRVEVSDDVRGRALKAVEDRLDARICAWVASVFGRRPDRVKLFGDAAGGHIAVPIGPFLRS